MNENTNESTVEKKEKWMTQEEYVVKAKKYGYSDKHIQDIIEIHQDAAKKGLILHWEFDLINLPSPSYPQSVRRKRAQQEENK